MIRLGLCCTLRDEPIKFGNTTVTAIARLERRAALAKLSAICLANADALLAALQYCHRAGIGCFRVNSQILPIKTHRPAGYDVLELPDGAEIIRRFRAAAAMSCRSKPRRKPHWPPGIARRCFTYPARSKAGKARAQRGITTSSTTVEVEAKAKEAAILKLAKQVRGR